MKAAVDVTTTDAVTLAKIVARGPLAMMLPLFGFAVLAGLAAGVFVRALNFVLQL